jgi:hypothetical protein
MPCVVQDGFPLVQAEMICDSLQLDFYGCTAMACRLWSRNAQGRSHLPTRSRLSWIERVSSGLGSPSPRAYYAAGACKTGVPSPR